MPNSLHEPNHYVAQTGATDPGRWARLYDGLPAADLDLCRVVDGLVIHPFMGGLHSFEIPPARLIETNANEVEEILSIIHGLDASPLRIARPAERLMVGHCRVASLILCSMMRHSGKPCRVRVGFAEYPGQNLRTDHWICERWLSTEGRWALIDGQWDDAVQRWMGTSYDRTDMPRDRFISGGEAWLRCRAGDDESTYGLGPGQTGLPFLRAELICDALCLVGQEPPSIERFLPDGATAVELPGGSTSPHDLDHLAKALVDETTKEDLIAALAQAGLQPPGAGG